MAIYAPSTTLMSKIGIQETGERDSGQTGGDGAIKLMITEEEVDQSKKNLNFHAPIISAEESGFEIEQDRYIVGGSVATVFEIRKREEIK